MPKLQAPTAHLLRGLEGVARALETTTDPAIHVHAGTIWRAVGRLEELAELIEEITVLVSEFRPSFTFEREDDDKEARTQFNSANERED